MRTRLSVLALAFLAACTSAAPARPEPIRIGALYPQTGVLQRFGTDELRGVETAVALFNADGGWRGRPVELEVANVPDVQAAWGEAHRLARSGVTAMIGAYGSTIALAASEVAHREKVLYWETGAVADLVTARGYPEVFRAGPSGATLAAQAARFSVEILAPRFEIPAGELKVAVVYEDDPYGASVGAGIKAEAARKGFRLVGSHPYDPRTEDFRGIIAALERQRPDVVVAATYLHDGARFREAVLEAKLPMRALIAKCAAFFSAEMATLLGSKIDGIFVADKPMDVAPAALTPAGRDLAERFRLRYLDRYGTEPDAPAYMGFSGAWSLLAHAMRGATELTLRGLQRSALALDVADGSLPNGAGVRFAPPGDLMAGQNMRALGVVWQWQDGKPVLVYPHNAARGEPELASA